MSISSQYARTRFAPSNVGGTETSSRFSTSLENVVVGMLSPGFGYSSKVESIAWEILDWRGSKTSRALLSRSSILTEVAGMWVTMASRPVNGTKASDCRYVWDNADSNIMRDISRGYSTCCKLLEMELTGRQAMRNVPALRPLKY